MTIDKSKADVEIDDPAGRPLAAGSIERDGPGAARASLHVEPGHLPPGTRTRLVDAVLDDPLVKPSTRLTAAVPRGDGELLDRLQERCDDVQMRPAGTSVMVEADTTGT